MTEQENASKPVEHVESADMDDILSSIKSTVEEETAKAEDGILVLDEADVLDADNTDKENVPGPVEERINLDAFADKGEVKTQEVDIEKNSILDDVVGEAANPPVPEGMAESEGDEPVENPKTLEEQSPEETAADLLERQDAKTVSPEEGVSADKSEEGGENDGDPEDFDIDALLAGEPAASKEETEPEASDDGDDHEEESVDDLIAAANGQPLEGSSEPATPEESAKEDLAESIEEPVLEESSSEELIADAEKETSKDVAEDVEVTAEESPEGNKEETDPATSESPTVEISPSAINLPASATAAGLQIAFPSEVLAEALRPLVKSWVEQNLPDIVERLVKEELERLAGSDS